MSVFIGPFRSWESCDHVYIVFCPEYCSEYDESKDCCVNCHIDESKDCKYCLYVCPKCKWILPRNCLNSEIIWKYPTRTDWKNMIVSHIMES